MAAITENKPNINVTPFIDILLVLLIIFMAISPLKPSSFKAKVPTESKQTLNVEPNINTLIVTVGKDSTLALNTEREMGTISEPQKLIERLTTVFNQRQENRVYSEAAATRDDLTEQQKIEKTVFIKAPRGVAYGEAVKVIDAVKTSGASPIALQIDDLED